ncbi:MlaD family protein [Porphyromonas gingivicanis]|uniref:MlaD family protein n=1 Tax=Porphyromonas gingivicanis TaxID=266762 RepID=UPI000470BC92|nr:MlaD family protein [Porphyromonas gingivicanis]
MKKTTKIALVGFWVVLAALILYLGINYLKGLSVFSNEKYYYARFKDVSGIVVASPVLINGYKVGTVQGLEFDMEHDATTLVKVNIDKSIRLPKAHLPLLASPSLEEHSWICIWVLLPKSWNREDIWRLFLPIMTLCLWLRILSYPLW